MKDHVLQNLLFHLLCTVKLGLCVALALVCLWPQVSNAQGILPTKWMYGPLTRVNSTVYSPDGTLLAMGGSREGDYAVVQIQTVATGAVTCLPTAANEAVFSVAFSPDGTMLAVGGVSRKYSTDLSAVSYSGVVELWNVSSGKRIATLATAANDSNGSLLATGGIHSVAFSPDGALLADGGNSSTNTRTGSVVEVWSVSRHTQVAALNTAANDGISSVAFSPDGSKLLDGGVSYNSTTHLYSGVLEVWNAANDTLLASLSTAANNGVRSVAFSPDGRTLSAVGQSFRTSDGSYGGVVELWNVASGVLLKSLPTVGISGVNAVAFSPDGGTLADGGSSGPTGQSSTVLELWNVSSGTRNFLLHASDVVNAVAFSPDGATLADGGQQNNSYAGVAHLWTVSTGALLKTIDTGTVLEITQVALSPDGKTLADSGSNTTVSFFELRNAQTGKQIAFIPNSSTAAMTYSPDGKRFAISRDNFNSATQSHSFVIELWNTETGQVISTLPTSVTGSAALAFSADSKTLAVAGTQYLPGNVITAAKEYGVIELWNASTGPLVASRILPFLYSNYTCVAFSPDGKTVAVGGQDIYTLGATNVDLWSAPDLTLIAGLPTASSGSVNAVAFSPDSKTLAVGGATYGFNTAVLELWDVPSHALRASLAPVSNTHQIHSLVYSPNGKLLFMGTDTNLVVFNAANPVNGGERNYYFQYKYDDGPTSVSLSADGRLLAYGTFSGGLGVTATPYSNAYLDFNNDGFTDLLLQNPTTGAIAAWYMKGSTQIGSAPFSLNPGSNYALAGVGDFAGDGTTTLVLQNRIDDSIAFWYAGGVNNTTITGGDFVVPSPFSGWKVGGVGDFNGDGKSDLVFQNRTTNQIAFWFMDGPSYQGGATLSDYPLPGWQVVGTGDFNGDGYTDLVFQNQTSGQIVLWFMHGITHIGGTVLSSVPDPNWRVVGVGDYNQDGFPDLIFQNRITNQTAVWYLQGSILQGSAFLSPVLPSGWQIVGPR